MRIVSIFMVAALVTTIAYAQTKGDAKIVGEIRKMDTQWIIEAYSTKDLRDFDRIVADDFLITGANGKVLNKAEKRANVVADYTAEWSPGAVFKIDEAASSVRVFGNTVVSTGFIIENYMYKTTKINGHIYFTNVYLKRKDRWQVVASQFTNIKQQ